MFGFSAIFLMSIFIINGGYYTLARRYEFYIPVARTIFHE